MIALLVLMASPVAGAPAPGPTSGPTFVSDTLNGGGTHRITWTNGDASAYTRIYVNGVLVGVANPGVTSLDTTYGTGTHAYLLLPKHYKNGVEVSGGPHTVTGWATV